MRDTHELGECHGTDRGCVHVSLEDRQNLNADAIQGELFSNVDTEEIKRGYRGTVASKVAGITYRQLDYWARKQTA